jgi:hypothetical protein
VPDKSLEREGLRNALADCYFSQALAELEMAPSGASLRRRGNAYATTLHHAREGCDESTLYQIKGVRRVSISFASTS